MTSELKEGYSCGADGSVVRRVAVSYAHFLQEEGFLTGLMLP